MADTLRNNIPNEESISYLCAVKRNFIITEDGSHTLFVEELKEHYHSIHGAVAESLHIFIDAAFRYCNKTEVRVLEVGFGTGLNALLTCSEAMQTKRRVHYHGVEKYPITPEEALKLNYDTLLNLPGISIIDLHAAPWERDSEISPHFTIHKEQSDFRKIRAQGQFDVIYFDAFAPSVQPELWSAEIFERIFALTSSEGILTTYSSMGDVRRALISVGFTVEKIPGPKGKMEVLRATRK